MPMVRPESFGRFLETPSRTGVRRSGSWKGIKWATSLRFCAFCAFLWLNIWCSSLRHDRYALRELQIPRYPDENETPEEPVADADDLPDVRVRRARADSS